MINRVKTLAIFSMVIAAGAGAGVAAVRQRTPPAKPPAMTVQANLRVGSVAYTANGAGECIFSDRSSMYDAPGSQWGVRHQGTNQSLNLSFWRLAKGGDMFSLSVTADGKTHQVNTMQVGPPANRRGAGTVTFEKRGSGGVFTLAAQAETGAKIAGHLTCSGFTRPEENGEVSDQGPDTSGHR